MANEVILDVRDDLKQGREPFHKIMSTVESLKPGQSLVIISSFEPRPLYKVLGDKGFSHRAEENHDGDWRITFFRPQTAVASEQQGAHSVGN